ncbi:MAG: trypsin-like serine protease, partial [Elusimicrobia bacterium]|nr:trypsin-like serine protease [Elusimicrobiota bacterium]
MNFKLLAAILLAPQMIPAEVHAQASLTQAQDILTSAVHHWKSDQRFISDNGNDALAYVPLNSIEYPWSAIGILTSVTSNGETVFTRFCTATLVGPSLIVTAAHCVKDMPNLWFGLDYDRGNGDNVGCDVDYLWIAKDYEPGGLAHDWAFAHLNCNA